MATKEVWKSIPGHKGYEVSNLGRVRSIDRWVKQSHERRRFALGRILRQYYAGGRGPHNRYLTTHLGAKYQNMYVHHLVALAFLGKTPRGKEICHNNGSRHDNRLENLRFDTRFKNVFDVIKHRYEQAWLNQDAKDTARKPRTVDKRTR